MAAMSWGFARRHQKRRHKEASAERVCSTTWTHMPAWVLRNESNWCCVSETGPKMNTRSTGVARRWPLDVVWLVGVLGGRAR